jgi:hypothetical protein
MWTTKLPALVELFPDLRVICCVRNPAWIVDSVERLTRRNKFEPSKIFNFEPGRTVYSRSDGLSGGGGMLGFALNAPREAVYGEECDCLLLVRYETLTANPLGTLAAIYGFIDQPLFSHDHRHIEPDYAAMECDTRLGAHGLHEIGSAVQAPSRRTVLPPDLLPALRPMRSGRTPLNCRRRCGSSDRARAIDNRCRAHLIWLDERAVRPSRRRLWRPLRMTFFLNAIKGLCHPGAPCAARPRRTGAIGTAKLGERYWGGPAT